MKTTLCLIVKLLTVVTLMFVPNSFAQDASPEYVVRIIYFLPNDRQPQLDIDTKLGTLIKDAQQLFADEMERHGFGRKTFRLETDATGKTVVHHVDGRFNDTYYHEQSEKVWEEIFKNSYHVNLSSNNVYLLALDISSEVLDGGTACGRGGGGSLGGNALIPASGNCLVGEFGVYLTAHELGHAFGLFHDFHNDSYVMSYGAYRNKLTLCDAEWLNSHRYFNTSQNAFNKDTKIEMHELSLESPPHAIRFRFEVTDPDGLHYAQLLAPATDKREAPGQLRLISCKELSGDSNTVEFVTTELTANPPEKGRLQVMDARGNFRSQEFSIDITHLLPQSKVVSIPDANLAAMVRETLGLTRNSTITQLNMLKLTELRPIEKPEKRGTSEHKIADLTGLEHATNLKYLYLWNNQIQDITPIIALKQLKGLDLSNNQINNISSLAELTQLTNLDLSRNPISDITPLITLAQLQHLSLGENDISDISELAKLTQLRSLYLWNNQINDITPLAELTQLEYLSLSGNNISDISPLVKLTQLRRLYLSNNQINDIIPLAELTQLEYLYLIGNDISDINHLAKLTQLRRLYLSNNQINDIIPLAELTELTQLLLYKNQISDITSLTALSQLERLLLEDNQITDVTSLVRLVNLRILNLRNNPILNTTALRPLLQKNSDLRLDIDIPQTTPVVQDINPKPPLMYWINTKNRTLHRVVDGKVENLLPDVQNATGFAVDAVNSKLYWTEKTGKRTGKIQRANLDGTNVQLIKNLTSVPLGITLNTVRGKLYLLNSWGKLQRLNFDGTNFQPNLIRGLESPEDIALDVEGGKVYWTEKAKSIRRANLDGSEVETFVDNLGTLGDITVTSGKIYWTERVDGSAGKIQRANLNGSNIENLVVGLEGTPANIVLSTTPTDTAIAATPAAVVVIPVETRLHHNYPNPFNPETWIPYQLAKPADVKLHIYAVDGTLVRTLVLGHQAAGMYQSRSHAAYWDGKNEFGEKVASGVYFYTLTANDFSATRKMLILK